MAKKIKVKGGMCSGCKAPMSKCNCKGGKC